MTRAAASSIASGRPSSRRHTSATASAFASPSANLGATACARSRNNCAASYSATPLAVDGASGPAVRGSTRTDCSTGKPSGARLVISSARRGHAAANRASSAPASSRYSKPSRTSSSSRGRRCINSRSRVLPFDSRMPSARAIVAATSRWSRTGARSTKNTPSGKLVCAAAATVNASRVLPTPLGPVRVTRCPSPPSCLRRFATTAVSCSRPTSDVAGTGS